MPDTPKPSPTGSLPTFERQRRILLVDDSAENLFTMRRVLRDAGYAVETANTVAAAEERGEEGIDLVVADVNLPDGSGLDLCGYFTERLRIPVVLRSMVSVSDRDRVRGLEAGADAYLIEPFDRAVLVATVRTILRNHELNDRLEMAVSVTGVGHWEWDVASGTVHWTPSLERLHGFGPGEFERTFEAFVATIHENDRARVAQDLEEAIGGDGDMFETTYEFVRTDGTTGHLAARARIIRSGDGRCRELIGVALDVTPGVVSARRNDALLEYAGALMAASSLAAGCDTIRKRGPSAAEVDVIDIEWRPSDEEAETVAVAPTGLLAHPDLDGVPASGSVEFLGFADDPPGPGSDGDGDDDGNPGARRPQIGDLGDGELAAAAVFRVVTAGGVGRIGLGWRTAPDLTADDRGFLSLFAHQSVGGLRQLSDFEQHRHIALTLQRSLLSETPEIEGLELASKYRPAGDASLIGGDWFEVFEVTPGRVGVIVGDIAGHGVDAAAASAAARHATRTALVMTSDVMEVLRIVDRVLTRSPERISSTAAALVLDVATGRAEVALAGHPPPLVRRDDGACSFIEAAALPLLGFGLWADLDREPHRLVLDSDDVLVLYTDGAIERRTTPIDVGLAQLCKVVRRNETLRSIVKAVVRLNQAETAPTDDTICLAVRRR